MLKQKQLEQKRIEDSKEQARIIEEQKLLFERYSREQADARKKEEEELIEKQKQIKLNKEIKGNQEREVEQRLVNRVNKKAARTSSPEVIPPSEITPFRSNSPPLPAVMKRMKEEGYVPPPEPEPYNEPPARAIETHSPPIHAKNHQMLNSEPQNTAPMPEPTKAHSRLQTPQNQDNREILIQLAAIQKVFDFKKELQNENFKVQQELEQDDSQINSEFQENNAKFSQGMYSVGKSS